MMLISRPVVRRILLALALTFVPPAMSAMQPISDGGETFSRRIKPHAQYLSAQDTSILDQAFILADRGQWDGAKSLASGASNPIVRRLVDWRFVSNTNGGADFGTISQFIAANPDWPNMSAIRGRAETAMPSSAMDAAQVIAWFGGRNPASGDGYIKLGDALIRNGDRSRGEAMIRRGWIDGDPSEGGTSILLNQYSNVLRSQDHEARLDRLLWERKHTQAISMFGRVGAGAASMATARIRLQTSARDADGAYSAVSGDYRLNAGLLFDRARWLRRRDRDDEATRVLIQAGQQMSSSAPDADAWWDERNVLARKALDNGQFDTAYALAAGHKIRPEDNLVDFAEGEFLAGWIALQYQNKPDLALTHFKRLRQGVTAPISVARAHYWSARCHAKAGRQSEARSEYQLAGQLPLTYYGQLALQETATKVRLSVPVGFKPSDRATFNERSNIAAMRALADIGEQGRLRAFALAAAEAINDGQEYANLVAIVRDLGETALSLRVAKRALQKNIPLFDLAYPTIQTPTYVGDGAGPETAFVLGITRQESEFDSQAVSPANAFGLMQLIPSTAKMTAKRHGINYDGRNSLLNPTNNMQLGMAHLGDLLGDFSGSFVMTAGAYNAGGGRVNEWVGRFGDPRSSRVDVVDWIERVPFSETRNYIQRVLENAQVYRAILNGREAPLMLATDLRRGSYTALASSAQFSSDPSQNMASTAAAIPTADVTTAATPQVMAAVRASPVVPDDDEVKPSLEIKPKAGTKAKVVTKAKSKAKAHTKIAKAKSKKPVRADASPKCKPSSKSKECRRKRT